MEFALLRNTSSQDKLMLGHSSSSSSSSSSKRRSSSMNRSWDHMAVMLMAVEQQQQQLQYSPMDSRNFTKYIPSSSRFVWTDSCAPKPACWGSCNCPVWPRQQAIQQQLQILEWPQPYTDEQYQAMLMLLAQQSHKCDCEAH
jgi:hypothetical protein